MNAAWLSVAFTIIGWIVMILLYTFKGGKELGENQRDLKLLRDEMAEMTKAISVNHNMNEAQWKDFLKDYMKFRLRIARQLGINGE